MSIQVVTAAADAVTESALVHAITSCPAARLVRRCRDVAELRAMAVTTDVDVAVVDGKLRGLDRDVVAQLAHRGVRCVVVSDEDEADLLATGVAAVVGRDLAGLPGSLVSAEQHHRDPPPIVADNEPADGRLVAVWGPPGAPGRSTVAIELAAALCRLGQECLLVDADTVAPSLAQQLGLIDDASGLAAAVRAAAAGRVDGETLAALAVSVPSGPRVLTGLPSAERWTELRPAATEAVLLAARSAVPWTVVDTGFGVEGDDLDWADPLVPQRYGAARMTLAGADTVICVGRADPLGVVRLLRGLPHVRDLAPTAQVTVVVNRGASRAARSLLAEAEVGPSVVLPDDVRSVSAASARGMAVGEATPGAPFASAVDDLAAGLVAGSYDLSHGRATRTHRRLLRRPDRRHRRGDARVV